MKIVVLDGYAENPGDLTWEGFMALGDLTVYDRTQACDIVPHIGEAEIIITNKTPLGAEVFNACPGLRYIGVLATGINVVDTEAAKAHGIAVTNIPTYGTQAVAQYVFALLLEICHHVQRHSDAVMGGKWSACQDFTFWEYPLIELAGKTMGIIGYGRIGQATAQIAAAFGMNVLAFDVQEDSVPTSGSIRYAELSEVLANSDVISLHCPLLLSTQGMINAASIAKMKDGAILINTARGPLIDEQALRDGLQSGKVSWAAVDVVSAEPIRRDNPLLQAPNIIITPHIAWAPLESRKRLMAIAVQNLQAFLAGKPQNIVNP